MENTDFCYYFIKLNVPVVIGLFWLIFVILLIVGFRHTSAPNLISRIIRPFTLGVSAFLLTIPILLAVNGITSMINPRHFGICYKVDTSWSSVYIPDVNVLCDKDGYREDEYGIPLFDSDSSYREMMREKHPEDTYQEQNYKYSDEELTQMAIDQYELRGSGFDITSVDVSRGGDNEVTLTLRSGEKIRDIYQIDGDSLRGYNKYYDDIDLGKNDGL